MNLLILAGTSEARQIAAELPADVSATVSLGDRDRSGQTWPCPVRVGGFGGGEGFLKFLKENKINAVLDATHPFAVKITRRSSRICRTNRMPYLAVKRPAWKPARGDLWHLVRNEAEAARHIPKGAAVLLTTGRMRLRAFRNLRERYILVRQLGAVTEPFPLSRGRFMASRGPFTVAHEKALFRRLGIKWLVLRNAGGAGAEPKLIAARQLGVPVCMIQRPALPDVPCVDTVRDALAWVRQLG